MLKPPRMPPQPHPSPTRPLPSSRHRDRKIPRLRWLCSLGPMRMSFYSLQFACSRNSVHRDSSLPLVVSVLLLLKSNEGQHVLHTNLRRPLARPFSQQLDSGRHNHARCSLGRISDCRPVHLRRPRRHRVMALGVFLHPPVSLLSRSARWTLLPATGGLSKPRLCAGRSPRPHQSLLVLASPESD